MDRIEDPKEKISRVLALAVVGEPQVDNDSLVDQITLTPCKICRDRLHGMCIDERTDEEKRTEKPPVVAERAEVYTVNANDTKLHKFQTAGTVHELHRERPGVRVVELP